MKNMTAFEVWQVGVLITQAVIMLAALLAAAYVGSKQIEISQKQNEINDRLLKLQDYVAISVVPGNAVISLLNTGKSNLYMWGFDMPNNNFRYEKPRLISVSDVANYWLPIPNLGKISTTTNFDFKLYLTDEYENKWISENGGEAIPKKLMQDGKEISGYEIKVWSYKTYKSDWQLK